MSSRNVQTAKILGVALVLAGCGPSSLRAQFEPGTTVVPREVTGESTATGSAAPAAPAAPVAPAAAPAVAAPAAAPGWQKVDLTDLSFDIPMAWKSEVPASSMRRGQVRVPKAEGDAEDGEIGVFYFGPSAGGVEANIQRWYGQMERPDGKVVSEAAKRESFKVKDLEVIAIEVTGTLKASMMPGMPSAGEKKGWMMVAAIVQLPSGPWFFKGTGPEKTMTGAAADFRKMLETVVAGTSGPLIGGSDPHAGLGLSMPGAAPTKIDMHGSGDPHAGVPGMGSPTAGSSAAAGDPHATTGHEGHNHGPGEGHGQEPAATAATATGPAPVTIDVLTFDLPAGWRSLPPPSAMRKGQLEIPKAEGDSQGGEMAVFYFGPEAGSIEANIDRWYGQITPADGKASKDVAKRESFDANGLKVTLIDVSGTIGSSGMMGGGGGDKPGSRMLAAIVEASNGPWFFKGTGPEKTMGAAREALLGMLKSMKGK